MSKQKSSCSLEGQFLDPLTKKWLISKQLGTGACGTVHALVRTSSSTTTSGSQQGSSGSRMQYVVKLAKLPPPSNNMKRKKTLAEKNADLLNHEHVLYRNVLNDLRGIMVPEVPLPGSKGPNGFGEIAGFRYLVMEKMESPLASIIPIILDRASTSSASASAGEIHIGSIAERFFGLMQAIHDTQHVFVDVKPENFMLVPSSSLNRTAQAKRGQTSNQTMKSIVECIRMIDFGLMESYRDAVKNKHRVDMFPNGQLVGTPVYASLNVLNGHTISRRDDLEACFYVWVEIILQLSVYKHDGNHRKNQVSGDLLPWSKAKSDEEIKRLKGNAMSDNGEIWKLIASHGNEHLSLKVKEIYRMIRSLDFKEKPNYDELVNSVARLKMNVGVEEHGEAKSSRSSRGSSRNIATTLKRKNSSNIATSITAAEEEEEEEEEEMTIKSPTRTRSDIKQRIHTNNSINAASSPQYDEDVMPVPTTVSTSTTTRASRAAARAAAKETSSPTITITTTIATNNRKKQTHTIILEESDGEDDIEMVSVVENGKTPHGNSSSHPSSSRDGGSDDTGTMDWEMITDENKSSASNHIVDESESTSNNYRLLLECIDGPHTGESFVLTDALVLGSNPSKRNVASTANANAGMVVIGKDNTVSANHAKLVLNKTGSKKNSVLMVKVFDLQSESGTFINNKMLAKGSSRQAFVKDQIRVGNSTFRISKKC